MVSILMTFMRQVAVISSNSITARLSTAHAQNRTGAVFIRATLKVAGTKAILRRMCFLLGKLRTIEAICLSTHLVASKLRRTTSTASKQMAFWDSVLSDHV